MPVEAERVDAPVLLDLSLVPAGKYSVKLEVGNYPMAVASRVIEVK